MVRDTKLYHITQFSHMNSIISSGYIKGYTIFELNGRDKSGVSLTRNKNLKLSRVINPIRITLDYKSLRLNGKLIPVHSNNLRQYQQFKSNIINSIKTRIRNDVISAIAKHFPSKSNSEKNKLVDKILEKHSVLIAIDAQIKSKLKTTPLPKPIACASGKHVNVSFTEEPWAEEFYIGDIPISRKVIDCVEVHIMWQGMAYSIEHWCLKNRVCFKWIT